MLEISTESWDQFNEEIGKLNSFRKRLIRDDGILVSRLLYRGQSDAEWSLSTTLERYAGPDIPVAKYYRRLLAAKPQIESFTQADWNIPSFDDFGSWLGKADFLMLGTFPGYEFMVYLRHHGFPSPLLDWTRSPFVGAFFAFRDIPTPARTVAIYAYIEHAGKGKGYSGGAPLISHLGPYVKTHRRHFLQQSEYTICTKESDGIHHYHAHDRVFSNDHGEQDLLWKITVPSSERLTALAELDSMNINAFSLFGSDDSLMATVALREFHLRSQG